MRGFGATSERIAHLAVTAGLMLLGACALQHPKPAAPSAEGVGDRGAVKRLLRPLGPETDQSQHDAVVEALVALGPSAVPDLAAARATESDDGARLAAVEALGRMRGPAVVAALLDALNDKSEDVRLSAVQSLGVIGDRRATQPLLDQFAKDDNPPVRLECLTSLGLIGDPAAVDVLVKGTADSDYGVRMWAIDALCQMNDAHAPALVVALMKDPNQYVREHVIESCGDAFNTPDGRATLINLAIDADQFVTTVWARRHLVEYLEHNSAGPGLREQMHSAALGGLDGPHAARAALLLGDLGDRAATKPLLKALSDPDPFVRHHAALLLAKVGDRHAVPGLIAALHDPVKLVAASAYNSLQWFAEDGDRRAQAAVRSYKGNRFSERLPRS